MSRNRDGVRGWRPASGEPHGGELCVARAAGREIAPHERHTLDGEPPELASLPGQQRVGQRGIAPRCAHAAEGGVDFIVVITEGVPAHDEAWFFNALQRDFPNVQLLGPNCPGIISPGKANIGITDPS